MFWSIMTFVAANTFSLDPKVPVDPRIILIYPLQSDLNGASKTGISSLFSSLFGLGVRLSYRRTQKKNKEKEQKHGRAQQRG